ncbi:MAG TPA: lamin tail domain-containing protein [Draconibacterium sp.]|nr:lamin tail domain-containing protein [Draconibacterium sp.]
MKNLISVFLVFFSVLIIPRFANSQVFINEFLASNTGSFVDPDFKESADWLELYNAGNSSVNIGGYYLTDNFNNKLKWQIPDGTTIEAGGFLVIWADSYNTGLHTNFNISADGEELGIFSASGVLIDSVSFGLQEPNISMGRKTDGSPAWGFFRQPSPGGTNSDENFNGVTKNIPQFSVLGGIFKAPVNIEITNTFGGEVRYTTDGSEPTENSPIVNGPINIDKTTIIRSRIYQQGKVPGSIVTQSYFINTENKIGSLPVVSIATNPENFWDPVKGIYVQDFKPEWEVPINIELFENDGSDRAGFNLAAGTKVNGLYSWQLPQKMLGVYFRKEYGEGKLDYPLLFDQSRNSYNSFALRASGSDWASTMFRDGMTQRLTIENMDVDFQGFRAAVLYVNGQYMGINNLRAKVDEDLIVEIHHLNDQKIDMVENENYAEAGTLDQYLSFKTLYMQDLSKQENFDAVAAQMDIENFTDFMIAEIYSQNTSVDHNIMAWKPQDGGKWKWILNDLDRGFFKPASNLINYYVNREVIPLSQLLANDGYKKYFGGRLADHLFTTFDPERVKIIIDQFSSNIEDEIPNHIERWKGTSSDYGNPIPSVNFWKSEIQNMKTFADARPAALLNDLKNYGFKTPTPLSVTISPENSGVISFNGIKINQTLSKGGYPENEEITLVAEAKAGFDFKGWQKLENKIIVGKEENWKYFDKGIDLLKSWIAEDFDDSQWSEGQAELGYGDRDENTIVDYGSDSGNKFITTYFRKSFTVENAAGIQSLKINLKYDDGAVVYINGTEAFRANLPDTEITFDTKAIKSVSGTGETVFSTFIIDKGLLKTGQNTIAVEIHQNDPGSSDMSFDLEMTSTIKNEGELFSTNQTLNFTHTGEEDFTAIFESDGSCILPEEISAETILNKACSPYRVPNNVTITKNGKLIIEPGVELWLSDDVSVLVNGSFSADGTVSEPIVFMSNPESKNQKWGILNFVNADTSYLKNVVIENASKGNHPQREIAAVSVFNSVLKIDGAVIEKVHDNPIVARYSDVSLKNSHLHSEITGDLINVKYGKAFIDSCVFVGNDMPDTDAVDYDDVENGTIKNSLIRDFHGFNSDAIDIGEKAKNISIQNMVVYNITDKGVSVGQQSSVNISNSLFVNCNLGAGLKDSSRVTIDHCTYYGNGTSVAAFEKNAGDAGGNGVITNSILSNSYDASYSADAMSSLKISYSASDNDSLPTGKNNLFVNPQFKNPNLFDFSLMTNSACLGTATDGNMGANLIPEVKFNQLFISAIAYKSDLISEVNEFVEITNSGNSELNISGFEFTKGITFIFPEGSKIDAGEKIYLVFNANSDFWLNSGLTAFQWESGRLADEGEAIQLQNPQGIVVDKVHYMQNGTWPKARDGEGISLKSNDVDNHFGESWEQVNLKTIVNLKNEIAGDSEIRFYPNPTNGIVNISGLKMKDTKLDIYNLNGVLVKSAVVNSVNSIINLESLNQGIYVVRSGNFVQRLVLLK